MNIVKNTVFNFCKKTAKTHRLSLSNLTIMNHFHLLVRFFQLKSR
ncbi:hypothetical protein MHA_1588 [Mannheimia haemolytica PHL213]|nr:hypothetical protein MHA_1588 [Mannheimia haemolytica PHL213]